MNEPNPLENLLHTWTPRRPSAKIRASLFAPETEPARTHHPRKSLNWLAPATICAFTMLVVLGGRTHFQSPLGSADTNLFASITMNSVTSLNSIVASNSKFNLSKVDLNLEQNVWRMATFESTNLGQSHSSMDSLPSGKTNSLMR